MQQSAAAAWTKAMRVMRRVHDDDARDDDAVDRRADRRAVQVDASAVQRRLALRQHGQGIGNLGAADLDERVEELEFEDDDGTAADDSDSGRHGNPVVLMSNQPTAGHRRLMNDTPLPR